jgi:hypothetical protein
VGQDWERENEGVYGECVLYPYIKIKLRNLLKMIIIITTSTCEERKYRKMQNETSKIQNVSTVMRVHNFY